MKKNRMMRLASILLVCVLLTTSVISGTFAKYVTSANSEDSARVAKWGFENNASITITDLFKTAYDNTVKSNVDVIAPGTSNEKTFSFSYDKIGVDAPEVDYTFEVSVDTTGSNTTKLDKNPNFVWKLDGTPYDTLAQLKTAIEALDGNQEIDGIKNKYEAGTLPAAFYNGDGEKTHTIGWEWKFDDGSVTKDAADNTQNKTDTAMGNADTLENVYIKITITATQID